MPINFQIMRIGGKRGGQVMLEAIVALTVMTIGMLGIFSVLSNSIGASRVSTNQEIAVNLGAEGIEVVKNMLDANFLSGSGAWNAGLTSCGSSGSGCRVQYDSASVTTSTPSALLKYDAASKLYGYSSGVDTIFRRVVTIDGIPSGMPTQLKVVSTVSWIDRNAAPLSVVLEDRFFDWR